jgi:hypothetical protein
MLFQGGGERKIHTHLRQVDMCKWQRVIPRHKQSPHYRIAHGWKDEYGFWSWILLKLLMHLESRRVFYLFIFILVYFFFFPFSFSLLSFFHTSSFSLFFSFFDILPLNSRLHCTYSLAASPMLRRLHILRQRGGKICVPSKVLKVLRFLERDT